jgi:hypothetical protein
MNGIEVDKFLKSIKLEEECPWHTSKFYSWQKSGNKVKGIIGEDLLEKCILPDYNIKVEKVGGSADHDLIDTTNGLNIEVKTGFALKTNGLISSDKFMWQHIGLHKNWDILVFIGVNHEDTTKMHIRRGWRNNPESLVIRFIPKKDIRLLIDRGYLKKQQGGQSGSNDDWMTGTNLLRDTEYLKNYEDYNTVLKNIS